MAIKRMCRAQMADEDIDTVIVLALERHGLYLNFHCFVIVNYSFSGHHSDSGMPLLDFRSVTPE